jgi:multidrug efflux system membrane fusion protein
MADPEPLRPAAQSEGAPRARKRHVWRWAVGGLVLLIVAAFVIRHETKKKPPPPPPTPVAVVGATATVNDLPLHLQGIGTVTALATATITSQVTAQIMAVRYTEGQLVHRGTPLFELDQRPFRAALAQAEGALERDDKVLAQARMDLERYRSAWQKNAIARQQLDDQEQLVKQDEGTVENDRGAVDAARINLQFCSITSPIDGRAGLRLVDPGNIVNTTAGTPLLVVAQLQPISVVFTISEDDLEQLWQKADHGDGIEVAIFDRARTRQLATGTLSTLDNQIDTTTGTVRARAVFDNKDGTLFPNQFVNTQVLVDTLRQVITVPPAAIQHDGDKAFVFAIADGHAHVRPVKVGANDGEHTQVTGIDAGTVVANSSFDKLRDGALVTVQAQTGQPPAPQTPTSNQNASL